MTKKSSKLGKTMSRNDFLEAYKELDKDQFVSINEFLRDSNRESLHLIFISVNEYEGQFGNTWRYIFRDNLNHQDERDWSLLCSQSALHEVATSFLKKGDQVEVYKEEGKKGKWRILPEE